MLYIKKLVYYMFWEIPEFQLVCTTAKVDSTGLHTREEWEIMSLHADHLSKNMLKAGVTVGMILFPLSS